MFCKVFSRTRFAQATMLTRRLSAKFSTSVLPRRPSTASSAPTEPSSTRSTSSATGGSTSTVLSPPPSPRPRTVSWQLPGKQQAQQLQRLLPLMPSTPMQHPREATLPRILLILDPDFLDTRPSIQGDRSLSGRKAGGILVASFTSNLSPVVALFNQTHCSLYVVFEVCNKLKTVKIVDLWWLDGKDQICKLQGHEAGRAG